MKLKLFNSLEDTIPILYVFNDDSCIIISHTNLIFCINFLKNHISHQYKLLSCISGVDLFSSKYRFGVVYDLLSLSFNSRIRIKIFVNEITPVPSTIVVFKNSDWWEREIWDMYGVYFNNHPNLRRILTDYGFESYPLRKDFPLSGYFELKYDATKKRVVTEPLELSQEQRNFVFESPWQSSSLS